MISPLKRGANVIDTDVYGAALVPGHALSQREHNADRWIAATALRLGIPLVSNDGIFRDIPGLLLETASS